MGSSPTFNIEVATENKDVALDIIEELASRTEHDVQIPDTSESRGEIHAAGDTAEKRLDWVWASEPSEYLGNSDTGLIIAYQPYYSAEMDTVLSQVEFLAEIREEIGSILHDQERSNTVSFYNKRRQSTTGHRARG